MKVLFSRFAVFILMLSGLITSCNNIKAYKSMQAGDVVQKQFSRKLPFERRLGIVVIPAQINGKTYQFLLDTGAPNLVSRELAEELGLTAAFSVKTRDSQSVHSVLDYVILDTVNVAGIDFVGTTAAVADLNQSNEIKCLHIDGIIGANLMRQAIWTIDYADNSLLISDTSGMITPGPDACVVPFHPVASGTPKITVQLGNVTVENVTADTGSNGELSLRSSHFKELQKDNPSLPHTRMYGSSSSGLYGVGAQDSAQAAFVPGIQVGNLTIDSAYVSFREKGALTFGTRYFQNYRVTFDWFKNTITFDRADVSHKEPTSFGFNYFYLNDGLYVNTIHEGSQAQQSGLQLGDRIVSINERDFSNMQAADWCDLLDSDALKSTESIHLIVERNGKSHTFDLKRQPLILLK